MTADHPHANLGLDRAVLSAARSILRDGQPPTVDRVRKAVCRDTTAVHAAIGRLKSSGRWPVPAGVSSASIAGTVARGKGRRVALNDGRELSAAPARLTPAGHRLIEEYAEIARRIALRRSRDYPHLRDDLLSAANLGLCLAAAKHDPSDPEPFRPFAIKFIRDEVFGVTRRAAARREVGWDGFDVAAPEPEVPEIHAFDRLIAGLPAEARYYLRRRFEAGLSGRQVANELELNDRQIGQLRSEAFAAIRARAG